MNVVDSSGWVEFFIAGGNGEAFRKVIVETDALIVPVVSLYEVHRRLCQAVPESRAYQLLDAMRKGRLVEITADRAVAASRIGQAHKLAFADAAIYAVTLEHGATLWTQDKDFEGLPSVKFLPKVTP
jgi:toxin FitB